MALTPEDLQQLGAFLDQKIEQKLGAHSEAQAEAQAATSEANAAKDYTRSAGVPDVDPTAGPWYYVHLANGDVVETQDSGATHMDVDGETVGVIGRFQKGTPPVDETAAPVTTENTQGVR